MAKKDNHSDIKLSSQSQVVHKQLHVIGLIIGIIMAFTAVVLAAGAGLKIYAIYLDFSSGNVDYHTTSCFNFVVSWILLMLITSFASLIFFNLFKAESPFSEKNIRNIRRIAVLLILLSILPITVQKIVAMCFGIEISFSINLIYIFVGITFYCLSFIFKHGEIIQEKNDETINVQEDIIIAFAEITEAKSGQTGQHVKRVSEYCRILAQHMGMSNAQVENLRLASMMHDVGKLLIPNEILEKESALTDEEYNIMKTHVIIGEKLLHNASGDVMAEARVVALEHHEQWDGGGYLGKKGDEINLSARIVAVADVFDALVSNRSYKTGWEPNKVYSMIVDESGKKFDPQVVRAFVRSYNEMLEVYNKYSKNASENGVASRANFAGYNYGGHGFNVSNTNTTSNSKTQSKSVTNAPHPEAELDLRHLI